MAQLILSISDSLLGSLAEPFDGQGVVQHSAKTNILHDPDAALCLGVALFGSLEVPFECY